MEVVVTDGSDVDTLRFADHTSSVNGNWFMVNVGTDFTIPNPITGDYDGVNNKTYTNGGIDIEILSTFTEKTVTYPFDTHYVNFPGDIITGEFYSNNTYLGDNVTLMVINATSTGLLNAYNDAINGEFSTIKSLLTSKKVYQVDKTIADHGSYVGFNFTWTASNPGDYVLVAVNQEDVDANNYLVEVYGAYPLEVLDYQMDMSVEWDDLFEAYNIDLNLNTVNEEDYGFGVVMVHDSAYQLLANLTTDGTAEGTLGTIKTGANPAVTIVENQELLGYGVGILTFDNLLNESLITGLLNDTFANDEVSYSYPTRISSSNTTVSLTLDDSYLTGTYHVLAVAWEFGTGRNIVGFNYTSVEFGATVDVGLNITSMDTNLPKPYASRARIRTYYDATENITGVNTTMFWYFNGVLRYKETSIVNLTIGSDKIISWWDTIAELSTGRYQGGNVTAEMHFIVNGTLVSSHSFDSTLTLCDRSTLSTRIGDVVGEWPVADDDRRSYMSSRIVGRVIGLWPVVS